MTIVTDGAGKVLGAVQGHSLSATKGGVEVAVSFQPGHQLHFVDVADDMDTITDETHFIKRLQSYLKP